MVTHCLIVHTDLTWSLYVHNHDLTQENCSQLKTLPKGLSVESLNFLLQQLERLHVCSSQPDSHFVSMVNARRGKILSHDGRVVAYTDNCSVALNGQLYPITVRTSSCEVISTSEKCTACKAYRSTLRAMYHRWCKRSTCELSDTSSHSNERYLNTLEKKAKMSKLRVRARAAEKKVDQLRSRIRELTEQRGEVVDKQLHGDLLEIMSENTEQIKKAYPEESFARLFWDEQLQAASAKDSRQIRWHPMMIKGSCARLP